jgi:long-chain acyl-CoA synthetase
MEVKLVGVQDESVEKGEDPLGILHVRGPPVGRLVGGETSVDEWVSVGDSAKVHTNGSFRVLTSKEL